MFKKSIIAICLLFSIVFVFKFWMLIIPITIENKKDVIVSKLKVEYGITDKIAKAIYLAHELSGYNPMFIAELALSESEFNNNAVSSVGYKGIMQTPTRTGYVEADVVHGVAILMDKFKESKGNILVAIALYKGGWAKNPDGKVQIGKLNPIAEKQARAFLVKYEKRIK